MVHFSLVAMGGTFDLIHRGHITLLSHAFEISEIVLIGLTSDSFAIKNGKNLKNNFHTRLENLKKIIDENFSDKKYEIKKLDNDFGPAVFEKNVKALIVSEETKHQGLVLNNLRREKDLPEVDVIVVPMFLAKDGERISSTRIRNSEIDSEGNLLSIDK
ncbi:MAG: phosphopantetheine adenylyltransferase [Nitrosopumilus sp.]|jgi:pantetheine-phosphate adenylyltransferase